MTAIEFVKKFGWERAKSEVAFHGWLNTGFWIQLKNLVNAYELVEWHGGLEKAKSVICSAYIDSNHDIPDGHIELSIAIELVEKCNASD